MLENQGKKVTEDTEKANILNKYFISVLTEEPDILNSLPDVPDANPQHILEVGERRIDEYSNANRISLIFEFKIKNSLFVCDRYRSMIKHFNIK